MGTLTAIDTTRLRESADRAADVLVETAIEVGERSTWLGVAPDSIRECGNVFYRTGDVTLYDGTAGIAMAAWSVAAALKRDDLAKTALGAARHAVAARGELGGIGLFDGLAGIGLAALEVGDNGGDERLRSDGLEILGQVGEAPPSDIDLISGSAGIVLALLCAARLTGSGRWQAIAVKHGEHLLAAAKRHPWGWSWPLPSFEGRELCGLAHGAAGVAWALGSLAAATGDARFLEAVDGARRYERSWFQRVENSWPDLRAGASAPGVPLVCPALWCHGATGIGLSRLALFSLTGHPSLAAEAASALQSATNAASQALRDYPREGLTLCHGIGGTLLLLMTAHHALEETDHLDAARRLAHRALDRLGEDPWTWPSGVPNGSFSPGLMTGLAGTMYALLRVAEFDRTCALTVLGDQGP
jgi:lantibiotic biosynthesis protein